MKRYFFIFTVLLFYPIWLILILILKQTVYKDEITKKHFMPWLYLKRGS